LALWTLFGLASGKATTSWPAGDGADGQDGLLGMPRYNPEQCSEGCRICADVCPTHAIEARDDELSVDYGRCVVCQLCTEACPTFGVGNREDLVWASEAAGSAVPTATAKPAFRRSLHVRHVDAGSCNGCESELQALNNPFYNLHRLGIFFTPSPRFADLLLVTGPVTRPMFEPLLAAYEAMPEPRWVMAVGTCAVSGGLPGGNYACATGLEGILPVDLYLPGCPPNPAALIDALMIFLNRVPQHVIGGRVRG
jgi:formate hydrogenlyase subunit 7